MPADIRMTIDERRTYLRIMRIRYAGAGKVERGQLLNEMEVVTDLDRKTLIRLLHGDLARHPRPSQRGCTYGPDVDDALRIISESYDFICAERLGSWLPQMARHLARHNELILSASLEEQLGAISIPTVRRILQRITQDQPRLSRPAASKTSALLRDIPMTIIPWDIAEPGHFETDLVHHSGVSTRGQYMHTLQLIDVKTGWSERVALLGRSYQRMEDAFQRVLQRLPFPIRELHPDNGSEFFNAYLLAYWAKEVSGADLSRSRPYHKNDNRFVEQKNSSEVRAYFGTQRLDTIAQTSASTRLYDKLWVYYNLFQPVMHMDKKTFLPTEEGPVKVKRHYDDAKPPFDRLCATNTLAPAKQEELERLRDKTNPRRLKQEIYDLLDDIFALPCADCGTE
jgi:hypothetical protein